MSPASRFDAFVAPARGKPALWRTLVGGILAAGLWILTIQAGFGLLASIDALSPRAVLIVYLWSFAALAVGLGLAARVVQGRPAASLIGPGGFRLRPFAVGAAVVGLAALPSLVLLVTGAPSTRMRSLADWAAWLPLVAPAVLIQTAAEEIAFRGYLLQSLAARFRSPLVWWLLPSLMFGALHWNPAELGGNAALGVLATAVVGLALADVTAWSGNLSAAIGLHFTNNVLALLVVASPGPIAGLALFVTDADPTGTAMRGLILTDLAATLILWVGWRALRGQR